MALRNRAVLAAACAAAMAAAACAQTADNSLFRVVLPDSLKGEYDHSEALFGVPMYGGSLSGELVYATPGASDYGCDALDSSSWPPNAVVMVDRGSCHFVKKARVAEDAGAVAMVVADDLPLCGEKSCTAGCTASPCIGMDGACQCRLPYMADDGSGGDIRIPSYLISKTRSDELKACLRHEGSGCPNGTQILVQMEWDLPNPDGSVDVQLWTNSIDTASDSFKERFAPLAKSLGGHIDFQPHYKIIDGSLYGCLSGRCGSQCTNGGRYCELDPDAIGSHIEGSDVVEENLRQMCIWRLHSADSDHGAKWWTYINLFTTNCRGDSFTAECSTTQQRAAGINPGDVSTCMTDAGGLTSGVNELLQSEMALHSELSILRLPTAIVNGVILRGHLSDVMAFQTVCQGFLPGTEPKECSCSDLPSEELATCVQNGGLTYNNGDTPSSGHFVSVTAFIIIIVIIVAVVAGAGFAFYKRSQNRMRRQVREILREYVPLDDEPSMSESQRREAQI